MPEKKRRKRNRAADLLAAAILLCLLITLFNAAWRYICYLRLDFTTAKTVTETVELPVDSLILRDEFMISAPCAGIFEPVVSAGTRISVGALIGYMLADQPGAEAYREAVYSPRGGVVYFELDGWEEMLTVSAMMNTDWSQMLAVWESGSVAASAESSAALPSTEAGRPVAKVIDNLVDVCAVLYAESAADEFIVDDTVKLCLQTELGTEEMTADVLETGALADGRNYLLVSCRSDFKDLLEKRALSGYLVGESYTGLLIDASSIVIDAEGTPGVYLVRGDSLVYTEVEIIKTIDHEVLIDGLLDGDRVVTNPQLAKEGQRVY